MPSFMDTPDTAALELQDRIDRLDRLIAQREDGTRGLGIRLALGLALEVRKRRPPGADTGEMVAGWMERFGVEVVDDAVQQARALLLDPSRMAVELQRRMADLKGEVPDA